MLQQRGVGVQPFVGREGQRLTVVAGEAELFATILNDRWRRGRGREFGTTIARRAVAGRLLLFMIGKRIGRMRFNPAIVQRVIIGTHRLG